MTLTKSQSKYLLNIYDLLDDKDYIKAIDLVKILNVSRSSTHKMLEILSDFGLISINDRKITLTTIGKTTSIKYKTCYEQIYKILSNKINGDISESIYSILESLSTEQLDRLCTTIN